VAVPRVGTNQVGAIEVVQVRTADTACDELEGDLTRSWRRRVVDLLEFDDTWA
jgi:hypothetical protein